MVALTLAERGLLPDKLIRIGIRRLLRQRLAESVPLGCEERAEAEDRFVGHMSDSAIALNTIDANVQHYEVPASFFELVMGRHLKYSCALYPPGVEALTDAEAAMLDRTVTRAQIHDGQSILELGCGWGSLSLWIAEHYPHCTLTAVSNSKTQRAYIEAEALRRGVENLTVVTADMNDFATTARFDRVVSVEMFEHMRNWRSLFSRIHDWLEPGGKLFFHVFCHRSTPYEFSDDGGDDDWMARHFFTGGMMPGANLPLRFQEHLRFERYYAVNGQHYAQTCEDWLLNVDRNASEALEILAAGEPMDGAKIQLQRWRLFFMACAELFAFDGGNEWHVGHYRFRREEGLVS